MKFTTDANGTVFVGRDEVDKGIEAILAIVPPSKAKTLVEQALNLNLSISEARTTLLSAQILAGAIETILEKEDNE